MTIYALRHVLKEDQESHCCCRHEFFASRKKMLSRRAQLRRELKAPDTIIKEVGNGESLRFDTQKELIEWLNAHDA